MMFTKNAPLPMLTCSACQGAGYVGIVRCRACRGMSMGRMSRGKFLYFGEPLTKYHITLRRARRWLGRFEILGGLVFGLGFLVLFIWQLYETKMFDAIYTRVFWLENSTRLPALFWLAIISFGYVVYRLVDITAPRRAMERLSYEERREEGPYIDETVRASQWETVRRLSRRRRVDIAEFFSADARAALEDAFSVAEKFRAETILPEHVFSALLQAQKVAGIFLRLGVTPATIMTRLVKRFSTSGVKKMPRVGVDGAQIIFHAYDLAIVAQQSSVYVTDLLLATVRQSEAIQELLYDLNIDADKLANVVSWVRIRERLREEYHRFRRAASQVSKYGLDRAMTAVATPYLNSFSQDLTIAAKFGYLAPCVARDKEITEIFRVIEGGRQSAILVGERGVGKMSVIEGIVERMIGEQAPKRLHDKRLVQLSTSALLAGTTVSGAEERMIRMMREVLRARNIILFIHNLHDLMSISEGEGGKGFDVAKTLAEYLRGGGIVLFATTTPEGFNRHIVNSDLGSVLTRIDVKEVDDNQAIQILQSKVGGVEYKHQVFFSYDALANCVTLSRRFLHDQNLPESALALLTEVASHVRNKRGADQLVTAEDVAQIVSEKTGVPVTNVTADESTRLLRLEQDLHKRVVGQEEAVRLVAAALRRARAEIRSTKRPMANFLFLGPTGVGKTELAKAIAEAYFGGEERMIRFDMSEYQDKTAIHRLLGQPGAQGTGMLTEAVRQHPFALLLLDEIEKADPDILNLFLQVFDDGRLTDSVGRVIDFTNTIIIATSNAGTSYVQQQIGQQKPLEQIRQELIRGELQRSFRPEFLNRFDGIVLFRPLEREQIKHVAKLMLRRVAADLEKWGVGLRVEDSALEMLADVGFEPDFGARPMRRAIQEHVENRLAEMILENRLKRRDTVVLSSGGLRVESGTPLR
ncbi:MAG: ATP-dependent Clp protease ATP-binding subunit [Candidatus Magasanikbacteria bacterium]|nr:ATP-dependent Clp protease ATP-binding subunit [Candidatus Magasanikbacteria bacterium]